MGKRGPAPGTGGRPRLANQKPRPGDGYQRTTVGLPGKGRQTYMHRKIAGVANAGPNVTVDHLNGRTDQNNRANLEIVSRSENTARRNRRRARSR